MEFDGKIGTKTREKKEGHFWRRYLQSERKNSTKIAHGDSVTEYDSSRCGSDESYSGIDLNESIDIKSSANGSMSKIGHEVRPRRRFDMFGGNRPSSRSTSEGRFGNVSPLAQNRPIPTAFELFNIDRRSESGDGQSNGINKNGSMRRTSSMSHLRVIPDNREKCRYCSNIMPKDSMSGHIKRKHKHDTVHHHVRANTNEIVNGSAADDKANFTHCTFCSALMHSDYIAAHYVRKHKGQNGSIGIIWDRSDDEIREWLNNNMIHVKDGVCYVNEIDVVN